MRACQLQRASHKSPSDAPLSCVFSDMQVVENCTGYRVAPPRLHKHRCCTRSTRRREPHFHGGAGGIKSLYSGEAGPWQNTANTQA